MHTWDDRWVLRWNLRLGCACHVQHLTEQYYAKCLSIHYELILYEFENSVFYRILFL